MDFYFAAVVVLASALTVLSCPPQCQSCSRGTADCRSKGLRDIPGKFPSDTVTIDLTENQLTDIQQSDFQGLPNVQNLRLSRNGLSAITPRAFKNLEQLMSLDLSLNPITRIHDKAFEGLSHLRSLTLTNTKLRRIGKPFNEIPNISSLYLGYNQLEQIEEDDFEMTTRVRSIDLSVNRIQSIHPRAFENLPYLRYLILKNNPIVEAKGLRFSSSMLQLVDFSQCELKSVPGPLPSSVADLRLSNNKITKIMATDFENNTNLQLLTLNENMISDVEYMAFATTSNLQELWLNNNKLTMIPRGLPIALEKLYMDQNEVHDIESGLFGKNASLETLSLNMNAVRQILSNSFSGLQNLSTIYLKGNNIQELVSGTFTDMSSLKEIDLSNNPLKRIQSKAFKDLPSLHDLQMSYQEQSDVTVADDFLPGIQNAKFLQFMNSPGMAKNFLKLIEKTRVTFPSIKVINLEYNELNTLPSNLKNALVNLEMMTLDGNPLQCDRRLLWLWEWMKVSSVKFYSFEAPTCAGPTEVKDRKLQSLLVSEFTDAPETTETNSGPPAKPEVSTQGRKTTGRQQDNTVKQDTDSTTGEVTAKQERVQGSKANGEIKSTGNSARKTTGKKQKGPSGKKKQNKQKNGKKKRNPKKNTKNRKRNKKNGKKGAKRGKRKIPRKCTKLPTGERRCCRRLKNGTERCRTLKPRVRKNSLRNRKLRRTRKRNTRARKTA
ncbi:leucine-rich repeat-containing protein 15-like isoform X1 [Saccostrea cucullata]|uniref:leucine-rich repeat-containing protein 15-like isoform X1 n=1 Tax=Saccostrea cuccullata TaxID=36930 RepID=UPI002ED2CAB9